MYTALLHHAQTLAVTAGSSHTYLAAGEFWATDLGKPLAALMKVAAILIVVVAAFSATKDILNGKIGKALGLILGAAVAVVFLWEPSLIESLISFFAGLFGKGVSTVDQVTR